MYYSLFVGSTPVYDTDENGNIIYTEIDGVQVPVELGTITDTYAEPVEFWATISSSLNELHAEAYGVSQSSIYSEISVLKDVLPDEFGYGTKIWKETEISYKEDGTPDESTADFTVNGKMTEMLNYDFYLLQRNNN